jgi:HEAT repeat protein
VLEPKVRVMAALLEEHLEEIQSLWPLRRAALRSPEWTLASLADLDERLEGHVQGMVVGGEAAVSLLRREIEQDDPDQVFAAGLALLHLGNPELVDVVLQALERAQGRRRAAIAEALAHGPEVPVGRLSEMVRSGPVPLAAAAAEALATHGELGALLERLPELLADGDADVRRQAWRLAAIADARPAASRRAGR